MKLTVMFYVLLFFAQQSSAQYFTLRGKQFYDETGAPFYPVVMPYEIIVAHVDGSTPNLSPSWTDLNSNYFLAPNMAYGASPEFEDLTPTTCLTQIENDFTKIQSMGFNTIRFSSFLVPIWKPEPNHVNPSMDDKFYFISQRACPDMNTCYAEFDYVEINNAPYGSDYGVLRYIMSQWDAIITLATSPPFNFKIIIEVGLGGGKSANVTGHETDYTDLLAYYGNHFKDNSALINYIIESEPRFSEGYGFTKSEVCDLTTEWYNALKTSDENHHLISTVGDITDVFAWDPAVIKADFFEIHPYPEITEYEKDAAAGGYSTFDAAMDRYKSKMYWFQNKYHKPFVIGETGFTAVQNPGTLIYDGTLIEQANYAEQTYKSAADCGSSAYVWWHYQDISSPWNGGDGFGLLKNNGGIPSTPADLYDKPAVQKFVDFAANSYIPDESNCAKPANYYDPFNHDYFNPTHTNAVTGTIFNADGNPVEDAVIEGLNWLKTIDPDNSILLWGIYTLDETFYHSWVYTFSNSNTANNFEIIPYSPDNPTDPRIVYVRGSAFGAERFERGGMWVNPYGWDDIQMNPANVGSITLHFANPLYDATVDNEFINIGVTQNFTGLSTLTVSNTTVDGNGTTGGSSDMTARNEVHITSDFHAKQGSDVHIFTSETFIDCDDVGTFSPARSGFSESDNQIGGSGIELKFKIPASNTVDALIIPNPNSGIFTVKLNISEDENKMTIVIKNLQGQLILETNVVGNEFLLNVSNVSKGIYFMNIYSDQLNITKMFIIN